MPNLTNNRIKQLAEWNNMLRNHYAKERNLSQALPGANLPALPGNNAAVARNNKLIKQVNNNKNGVPPTPANAAAVAQIAAENNSLKKIVPNAMAVNNNTMTGNLFKQGN